MDKRKKYFNLSAEKEVLTKSTTPNGGALFLLDKLYDSQETNEAKEYMIGRITSNAATDNNNEIISAKGRISDKNIPIIRTSDMAI